MRGLAGYMPIMLDCEERDCIVVGGGLVAERKVQSLLAVSAVISVISPDVTENLRLLYEAGRITWVSREFTPGDLAGASLVYAATHSTAVNAAICAEAKANGVLINVVTDPDSGTFISPSVLRRGRLMIAVSTSGAGPAVAAEICDRLENEFGPEYEDYLEFLYMMRKNIKQQVTQPETRQRLLKKASGIDVLGDLRGGTYTRWDSEQIRQWIVNNQEE